MTATGTSQTRNGRDFFTSASILQPRTLAAVLAGLTAWRLVTGAIVGIADAEAYDWIWSKFPSASYFDHPPAIAWLIHATTSIAGDTPLGVRLGPILLFPATTAMLFLLGRDLFSEQAAVLGCLSMIATPVFHLGGVSASPDTPLAFFWALALLALWRTVDRGQPKWLYAFGAAVGLAFLSKYFAVLLPVVAFVVFLRPENRRWFGTSSVWVATLVAIAITTPVVYWNARHDFASFRFHLFERHHAAGLSWTNAARLAIGQLGYVSPLLLAGYLWAIGHSLRRWRETAWGFVAATSVPVLAFFWAATLWTPEAEPHWPILGYLPACLAFGQLVNERLQEGGAAARRVRTGFAFAVGFPAVLLALLYVHLLTPVFVSLVPDRWYDAKVDIANELQGWPEAGRALRQQLATMPRGSVVLAYHYTMCSQAAFALADPSLVRCVNTRTDALDFLGLGTIVPPADAVYVRDNRYSRPPEQVYRFERSEDGPTVTIHRGDRVVRTFMLTRLFGVQGLVPGVQGL